MGQRVLITGASGFLGQAVARRLAGSGYEVVGASRRPQLDRGPLWPTRTMPAWDAGSAAFSDLFEDITHVVHAAGLAHAYPERPEKEYCQANTRLTASIARAAADATAGKLIVISSIRAQCGFESAAIQDEDSRPEPSDAYGRSKLDAEREAARAYARQESRLTILRPVAMYGPRPRGNMRMLMALADTPLPLPFGNLKSRRSLLQVESMADAVLHSLRSHGTDGSTFVVSDEGPLTVGEMIAAMRLGLSRPARLFSLPGASLEALARITGQAERWRRLTANLIADSSRLRSTGWTPCQSLEGMVSMAKSRVSG